MKNLLSNKKVLIGGALVIIFVVVAILIFKGKDNEQKDPTPTPETESSEVVEEIDKGNGNNPSGDIIDITALEPDDFVKLTWEQIRDFTEARLPNYREIYGISEDTVMAQEDWEELKKIMFWQLYGQTYDSYVNVGNVSSDVEIETNDWGTDIIYVEPTLEYIEGLSTSEFLEYMKGFLKFAEAGDEAIAALDILNDEQIEEMRQEFIKEYFENE